MKKILLIASILATSVYAKDSISIGTFADGTEFIAEKHFFGKRIVSAISIRYSKDGT